MISFCVLTLGRVHRSMNVSMSSYMGVFYITYVSKSHSPPQSLVDGLPDYHEIKDLRSFSVRWGILKDSIIYFTNV